MGRQFKALLKSKGHRINALKSSRSKAMVNTMT